MFDFCETFNFLFSGLPHSGTGVIIKDFPDFYEIYPVSPALQFHLVTLNDAKGWWGVQAFRVLRGLFVCRGSICRIFANVC